MSRYSDYRRQDEERREERRKYKNDVFYDVWRSGGNPDRIDDDRVFDHYYKGLSASESADAELRRMLSAVDQPPDVCDDLGDSEPEPAE